MCLVTQIFTALCVSGNHHEITTSVELKVTKKFQQVGAFTNTESIHNEYQLYVCVCVCVYSLGSASLENPD